ncbi:uncharacterized protein ddias [Syngnathus acus]|uniref:uncharacterized protein ddias n=1 Tax=Syngnathus acus TaxID=161584 RepID=UPI00188645C2|nr:uncharacterized protein ddias [Syngnathus acus]XP_037103428.1 uncharacterized protein ddias [Syngnathus acus]
MSVRRALVDCTVLSLQDPCVFYPCCKNCFCRMDVEPRNTTRSRCSRCAYNCERYHLEYRYRLSVLVTRDTSIFGVTVFGSCLNPFFGIPATQFQRVLENSDGPGEASTGSKLLARAVEDCFIGRHLVFGIKVTDSQSCPWLGDRNPGASGGKDMPQFTATQLIFPKVAGLEGHSVLRCYQCLLRKAEEHQRESVDSNKSRGIMTTLPRQIPQDSPASSFNNVTLSRLFSHSLHRSRHHDGSLTPTPPWQQSLGLVTSSAEQEEEEKDCCTSDDNQSTAKGQCTFFDTPPFSLCSPARNIIDSSLKLLTPAIPPRVNYPLVSECQASRQPEDSLLSRSLVWEDLPFSESLTAFFNEQDKYFDTTKDNNLLNESISACTNTTKAPGSKSRILTDIANTKALNEEGEGVYNCSLDLFSLSSVDLCEEIVQPPRSQKRVKTATEAHKTPSRDITHWDHSLCLDFIPSSQSTPNVRICPSSSSPHPLSSQRLKNISKRRFKKHCLAIQGGIRNGKPASECDTPRRWSEDDFVIVPPTPAKLKVENDCSQEKMPSHLVVTKRCDAAGFGGIAQLDHTIKEMPANVSLFKDEACDWSRDLFSDSV